MRRVAGLTWLASVLVCACGGTESNEVEDCNGVEGGDAVVDECGTCDDDRDNDCLQDCAGDWGGGATLDECNTCDDDPDDDCVQDCAGEWGGDATEDLCGTCDADPGNDCVEDCLGVLGGPAYTDRCGVCVDRGAREPAVLWGDDAPRPLNEDCSTVPLPSVLFAEGIRVEVRADAVGVADVSISLRGIDGGESGSVLLAPANLETVGTTEAFAAPVVVESLIVCSLGNPATLLDVAILGNGGECRGDCADNWPGARAYRDTCGTCIDRDATPPEVLYRDQTERWMGPDCSDHDISGSFLVEELAVTAENLNGAISDAWVYLLDPAGVNVGSIEVNPADLGTVSASVVFEPPIAVTSMHICSWWNPANLLDLQLLGDPAACTP